MTRFDFENLKTQGGLPKKCEFTQVRVAAHAYQFLFGLKISKIVRFLSLAGLYFASFLQIFGDFFGKILGHSFNTFETNLQGYFDLSNFL